MSQFSDLNLQEGLLRAVEELGFTQPTAVQSLVIPTALTGCNDLMALAQTGTGKTAAFGLPLLQLVNTEMNVVQGLVLCPTRELCMQVASDLVTFGQHLSGLKVVAVYGGARIEPQISQLRKGAHVVVATPGRLIDLLGREAIALDHTAHLVLDEADEMLNMGFRDDLDLVLAAATHKKTTWLFSATMSKEVRGIASKYMYQPVELSTGQRNQSNENIEHLYYVCRNSDRYAALKRIVDATPNIFGLIFCRTKAETKEISDQMMRDGYNSNALHGDMTQPERERVMTQFRDRSIQLLVATDVAARGLDISDISHVIHYGLPDDIEVYTHRSGRTGRAGKTGTSIVLLTPSALDKIPQIERESRIKMKQKSIPTGDQVCETKLMEIVQTIRETPIQTDEMDRFLPQILESFADLSKEELIARFASVEFNRFLNYYRGAKDLNLAPSNGQRGSNPNGGGRRFKRVFANAGIMDGLNRREFVKILNDIGVPSRSIGDIDMKKAYSHFELAPEFFETAAAGLSAIKINGRTIRIDHAEGDPNHRKQRKEVRRKGGPRQYS